MQVLAEPVWRERMAAHERRVDAATDAHLRRRHEGRNHPVEDFLWTYYSLKPAQLRRWHPGAGVALASGSPPPHAGSRFYVTDEEGTHVDLCAFLASRGDSLRFIRELLSRTVGRPGRFGCFGLHEWAMVYRLDPAQLRHSAWPLRLGRSGTDAVVESHQITCSHFDAYRFFTPDAAPRNSLRPTRASQAAYEQPACLHAGMDLYKWAAKLTPAVPSELVMDCFELARELRELDMRASPYDLRELGYDPVPIETTEGKATYAAEQRAFAARGQALRGRLLEVIDHVSASAEWSLEPSSPESST